MSRTGSIPFLTSGNSSRSLGAFFGAIKPMGESLRQGFAEDDGGAWDGGWSSGVQAEARPGFGMGSGIGLGVGVAGGRKQAG